MKQLFSMVVPTIPKDINTALQNLDSYFEYLPVYQVIFIGNDEVKDLLPSDKRIIYINEKEIADIELVKRYISNRDNSEECIKRAGWYVQQFIKMGYAGLCNDKFYLLWDSDTFPIRKINFIVDGHPIFDMKTEYHHPYFHTIQRLLSLGKSVKGSFISEHMLIKTSYMQNLISDIEKNDSVAGTNFQEKIINAIDYDSITESGFSEFETYDTYVSNKFHGSYKYREWHSLRQGGRFFKEGRISDPAVRAWLAKYYDAVSVEKTDMDLKLRGAGIIENKLFQKIFNPKYLVRLSKILPKIKNNQL